MITGGETATVEALPSVEDPPVAHADRSQIGAVAVHIAVNLKPVICFRIDDAQFSAMLAFSVDRNLGSNTGTKLIKIVHFILHDDSHIYDRSEEVQGSARRAYKYDIHNRTQKWPTCHSMQNAARI
jgi:hypothetical protein